MSQALPGNPARRMHVGREFGLAFLLGLLCLSVWLVNPAFASGANLRDILVAAAPLAIVGCGLMFVMLAGEIDLSVGSLLGLLAVVMGRLAAPGGPELGAPLVIGLTLGLGALVGLANGLLVALLGLPSVVVTLAMLGILRGLSDLLLGGVWITELPSALRWAATGAVFGVPYSILIAAAVGCVALRASRNAPLGLSLRAIGSNADAARLAGVRSRGARVIAFGCCGLLTALAMLVSVPQLTVIEAGVGLGFELVVITCVVVGGTAVTGGRGTVVGVLAAVLLFSSLRTGLIFLKLGESATYWERAAAGALVLGAVLLDRARATGAAPALRDEPLGATVAGRHGYLLHEAALLALLLAFLAFAGSADAAFVAPHTQRELAAHAWELALLALPMTLLLIAGGIDVSIGSNMALAAVSFGIVFEAGAGVWLAAAAALAVALAGGVLNGVFIARLKAPPLIVTLATMAAFRGIAEGLSAARPVSGFPTGFLALSGDGALGLPLPGLLLLLGAAACALLLSGTATGRRIVALGAGETAARFGGIAVARIRLGLYALSGLTAGIAALVFIARRNTAKADIGTGLELEVITAVVLGGVSLRGGRGTIIGALLGVALIHELREFVSWRWARDEFSTIAVGLLLIASGAIGSLRLRAGRAATDGARRATR